MATRKYRILAIASHPVQYAAPIFRRMAAHPGLDFQVAYCTLRGAEGGHDPEFGTTVQWDVPLLDGYAWSHIPNRGSGRESFFGLFNPGLWKQIRLGEYDAVLCYVGYVRASFWIAFLAARFSKAAFLFGTDATSLAPRDGRRWKISVKKFLWPKLFRLADQVLAPSSAGVAFMRSLSIPEERITLTPFVVDNDWWAAQSASAHRDELRSSWGVSPNSAVILFCAKLQPWKRPLDVLEAFAKLNRPDSTLVFAGDGPLRGALEQKASEKGLNARVRFLGFVNQSRLPEVYTASDVMVLPSEYEPFGLVVNEALCCGCPVIASDRVGATTDLIMPLHPRFVFPCGDVDALTRILAEAFAKPTFLKELGRQGAGHMQAWSPERYVAETVAAIDKAARGRAHEAGRFEQPSTPAPRQGIHE